MFLHISFFLPNKWKLGQKYYLEKIIHNPLKYREERNKKGKLICLK